MRRNSGGGYRKEKAILIASGVLVMTAMTVTGIYIHNSNQTGEPESNIVDFSALENGADDKNGQLSPAGNGSAQNRTSSDTDGELDYDPYYARQDEAENGGGNEAAVSGNDGGKTTAQSGSTDVGQTADANQAADSGSVGYSEMNGTTVSSADGTLEAAGEEADGAAAADPGTVADTAMEAQGLHFSSEEKLNWPIAGNVLLNYSMDKTIYFPTLQQYKYNPSIVISAAQGTSIASASDGIVKDVYKDSQTGNTVVMDLGDGYELTYGQLQDVSVEEGDFVESGVFIGKVAAPTKYYSVEGTNVYFKLTKDGVPVNPMDFLG